jgi:hypothetical protein
MKNLCYKKCKDSGLKYTNGVSNKMVQSAILQTNGKNKIPYSNTKTNTINNIIISADFEQNKKLLLCLHYDGYQKYLEPLLERYPQLSVMFNEIILSLTPEEYNKITYKPPKNVDIVPVIPEVNIVKTYYVVTRKLKNVSYFIYKNYTYRDIFYPTYSYKFDVSDLSNVGRELSFSLQKDYIEFANILRNGEAGTPNASVILTIPVDIKQGTLYIYNKSEPNLQNAYIFGGYSLQQININLESLNNVKRDRLCKTTPTQSYIYDGILKKKEYIEESIIPLGLLQSSILSAIPYNGLNIYIYDINSKETVLFYNTNKYGLYIGTYYIFVPRMYQLAFLNIDQSSNFVYSGEDKKKIQDYVIGTESENGLYNFYYGTIKIEIKGSFNPISIYTLQYGYLSGYKRLMYYDDAIYKDKVSKFSEKPKLINY